jgi:hypothetical protein
LASLSWLGAARISGGRAFLYHNVPQHDDVCGRRLSLGTTPERIEPESLTQGVWPFVPLDIWRAERCTTTR